MKDLTINGVNYGDSFADVPPEMMKEIANITIIESDDSEDDDEE